MFDVSFAKLDGLFAKLEGVRDESVGQICIDGDAEARGDPAGTGRADPFRFRLPRPRRLLPPPLDSIRITEGRYMLIFLLWSEVHVSQVAPEKFSPYGFLS